MRVPPACLLGCFPGRGRRAHGGASPGRPGPACPGSRWRAGRRREAAHPPRRGRAHIPRAAPGIGLSLRPGWEEKLPPSLRSLGRAVQLEPAPPLSEPGSPSLRPVSPGAFLPAGAQPAPISPSFTCGPGRLCQAATRRPGASAGARRRRDTGFALRDDPGPGGLQAPAQRPRQGGPDGAGQARAAAPGEAAGAGPATWALPCRRRDPRGRCRPARPGPGRLLLPRHCPGPPWPRSGDAASAQPRRARLPSTRRCTRGRSCRPPPPHRGTASPRPLGWGEAAGAGSPGRCLGEEGTCWGLSACPARPQRAALASPPPRRSSSSSRQVAWPGPGTEAAWQDTGVDPVAGAPHP